MPGLQIIYSKELARELGKTAVVLPGTPVDVGDILYFPDGLKGIWPFRKRVPRGSFSVITRLSNLGVKPPISLPDPAPDPFIFASRKGVDVDFQLSAEGGGATGKLSATFKSEGAVYFAAVGCSTSRITDLPAVQRDLAEHSGALSWDKTFLVTSLTTASRAVVMQSSTSSATLEIEGDIKGLATGSGTDIDAGAQIRITRAKEASFIKDWSKDVTVFMMVHRFKKGVYGFELEARIPESPGFDTVDLGRTAGEIVHTADDRFVLEAVSALEVLDEIDLEER